MPYTQQKELGYWRWLAGFIIADVAHNANKTIEKKKFVMHLKKRGCLSELNTVFVMKVKCFFKNFQLK